MKKNLFFTFCCALIPGFGQMYQGYMKRGLSLMFWFCADIGLMAVFSNLWALNIEIVFGVFLPVIWAYSFFDTFNLRNLSAEQRAAMGDYFLPGTLSGKEVKGFGFLRRLRANRVVGWVLIAVGVLALYNAFWNPLYRMLWEVSPVLADWMGQLPGLVIAVVVIIIGIWMLRGKSRRASDDDADDSYDAGDISTPPYAAGPSAQKADTPDIVDGIEAGGQAAPVYLPAGEDETNG